MPKERNAFKAGLFIVTSIALAVTIVISIKGAGRLTGPRQARTAYFKLTDDLGGLRVGDDVRIGGVKVGTIKAVELVGAGDDDKDPNNEPRLAVEFLIPRRVVLHEGVVVGVQTTLTGASVLNVESLGAGAVLADGASIVGTPDPKSALIASLGRAGPKIEATVSDAQLAIAGVKDKTLPKVGATFDRASEAMVELRDTLGPSKTDYKGTIANLNVATADLKKRLPELLDQTTAAIKKVDGSLTKAQTSLDDLSKTLENARDLTAATKEVLAGNKGRLNGMIAGLKVTADNLKAASAEIRRSPWRLLYKPAPNEMANLNIYDSARQFAEGAGALEEAAAALRDAAQQKNADPAQVKLLMQKLDESFDGFKQVEQKLWSEVKE